MKRPHLQSRHLIRATLIGTAGCLAVIGYFSYHRQSRSLNQTGKAVNVVSNSPVNLLPTARSGHQSSLLVNEAIGKLPLSFEANQGQTDPEVRFFSRGNGYSLFLTPTEAVFGLSKPVADDSHNQSQSFAHTTSKSSAAQPDVLRMELKGANRQSQITGQGQLPGKSNYLIGHDPQKWRSDVARFEKVSYHEVYPGIDLTWYGSQRQLEYDWIVSPGADPGQIRLAFSGISNLRIDDAGDLVLQTSGGELHQHQPVIYQESAGARQPIAGRYIITGQNEVGFEVKDFDVTRPLVIDPVFVYSTYLGGSNDELEDPVIAVDTAGNMYIAGRTLSTDYPTKNPYRSFYSGAGVDGIGDGFVAKISADGSTLIFSTYLGGSGDDEIFGIALDSGGNVYLTGDTSSTNFPLMNPLQSSFSTVLSDSYHIFITKLSADGSALVYSTYLGGSGDTDFASSITVDTAGNAYVTGATNSTNFPLANALFSTYRGGTFDAFLTKLNPTGTALVYSTFFGGGSFDEATDVAVDDSGVYLSGVTSSGNFPLKNAFRSFYSGAGSISIGDGFVTKFSADGASLVYSTYLGGNGDDEVLSIALAPEGTVCLTGSTSSTNFPLVNPYQSTFSIAQADSFHVFVSRLSADGSALIYSTYLGGSGDSDFATSIGVDAAGNAYLTGATNSTDFPVTNAIQSTYQGDLNGVGDAFVVKLNSAGSALIYSTFLGGANDEISSHIKVDATGNAWIVGITNSTNYPTQSPLQSSSRGGTEHFITKLGADAVTVSAASYSSAALTSKAIVAAFGPALATSTAPATALPLPTTLAGTTVKITDSTGTERLAPLFFVSQAQVNYEVPADTAAGPASVTITSGDGHVSSAVIQVAVAAPSIFTTNSSGTGAAAAIDAFNFTGAPFSAKRATGEQNIIALFATGLGADATDQAGDVSANVQVKIDGSPAVVLYAGQSPGLAGLNQLNILLPAGITSGTHPLVISRKGVTSNTVSIAIK